MPVLFTHSRCLVILLFAAPIAKFIPLCVLSAILLVVAYNMGEWGEAIPELLKLSRLEAGTWFATFMLTDSRRSHRGCGSRHDHGCAHFHSQSHSHHHH